MTPHDFASALLDRLGFPNNQNNIVSIVAWEALEGGHWHNAAKFNPLNTSQPMPGSFNPGFAANVQAYVSWDQGIEATAKTLLYAAYSPIREALLHSADPNITLAAIAVTPWGTKNVAGKDPYALASSYGGTPDVAPAGTFGRVAKLGAGAFAIVIGLSFLSRGVKR